MHYLVAIKTICYVVTYLCNYVITHPFTLLYIVVSTSLFHAICSSTHFHMLHLLQSVRAHKHVCITTKTINIPFHTRPSNVSSDPVTCSWNDTCGFTIAVLTAAVVGTGNTAYFLPKPLEHRCHHQDRSGSGMFVHADWQTACGIDLGLEVSTLCPIEGAETVISDENKSVIAIISIILHQTCDILEDKMFQVGNETLVYVSNNAKTFHIKSNTILNFNKTLYKITQPCQFKDLLCPYHHIIRDSCIMEIKQAFQILDFKLSP